ncbi:MAG: FAD-binding oxidoreductase [Candidatus Helarchaeota archaeon]
MVLEHEILIELQNIVGINNVSDNEVITDTYAYNWCAEILNTAEHNQISQYSIRPIAVILPSTVEEVQQIIKVCNKYNLSFKAQSTGFGPWNQPSRPQTIIVDLRRMNRIIKIDPKNLYTVVEPYVSGAQLQAELMKYGLNCHMPGAGPQVSPLASATSMAGPGFTSPSTSHSARNVLGVEWVLPNGDILRLGACSLKNNSDWYTGDGPGPSLRGIMRGIAGTKSGLGIFTKVAVKLYPYPCDTKWKISGYNPFYDFEIPNYMQFHIVGYKNYDDMENGFIRIEEEEICFICSHSSSIALAALFANRKTLFKRIFQSLRIRHPLFILIAARTEREFKFKEKVLAHLIKETKGRDATLKGIFKPSNVSYAEALRSLIGFHGFLAGGTFQSTHGGMDTFSLCRNIILSNVPLKKQYIKKKVIADDRGKGFWSTSYESGHFFHVEMPTMYDQRIEKSVLGMYDYLMDCNKMDLEMHFGIPFFIEGDKMHEWYGPECCNYHIWLRKIKETFDPNNIADPGFYISSNLEKQKTKNKK